MVEGKSLAGAAAAALIVAVGLVAHPAAQDVQVNVVVPDVVREVRRIVDQVAGQDIGRQIRRIVDEAVAQDIGREIHRAIAEVVSPQVGRDIGRAVREAVGSLGNLDRLADLGALQDRDFKAEQSARETRTLSLGAAGSLDLRNLSGDITVTAGSSRDTIVEIVRRSRGRTEADAKTGLDRVTVAVDVRGERATVETQYPDLRRAPYTVSVAYIVTAPAGTRVSISSTSSNVTLKGITGEVGVGLVSGDITITGAGRISSAHTISGSITVTGADSDGTVDVSAMSGNVLLQQVKAKRINVSAISGDVVVRGSNAEGVEMLTTSGTAEFAGTLTRSGRYSVQSHSGSVRIAISGTTGFSLDATTFSGSVRLEPPLQLQGVSTTRRSTRGTVGDGSATVIARAFSGDVIVTRR